MVFFGRRYYEPTTGRFLTPDPLGFADGPNLYAYVHNSPLILIDPYGLLSVGEVYEGIQEFQQGEGIGALNWFTDPVDTVSKNAGYLQSLHSAALNNNFSHIKTAWDRASGKDIMRFAGERSGEIKAAALEVAALFMGFGEARAGTTAAKLAGRSITEGGARAISQKTAQVGARALAEGGAEVVEKFGISNSKQLGKNLIREGKELVQRAMSKAELNSTRQTGLLRGGREGPHYVSNAVNKNPLRARQRLALPQTPEFRVTLEVPTGKFSSPQRIDPKHDMPGGGRERVAHGRVPVGIMKIEGMH